MRHLREEIKKEIKKILMEESEDSNDEIKLENIPDKTFKIELSLEKVLNTYSLPKEDDINYDDVGVSRNDVHDNYVLSIEKIEDMDELEDITEDDESQFDEHGYLYLDKDDKVIDDKTVDELWQITNDASVMGTESSIMKEVIGTIEEIFETFSNYKYDYEYMGDGGYENKSGTAKGVEKVEVMLSDDKIILTVHSDIIHVINNCIAGEGTFYPSGDLEGEDVEEYAKSRIGWLKYHWEIYGDRAPSFDNDRDYSDFDEKYFKDEVKKLEASSGYKLI